MQSSCRKIRSEKSCHRPQKKSHQHRKKRAGETFICQDSLKPAWMCLSDRHLYLVIPLQDTDTTISCTVNPRCKPYRSQAASLSLRTVSFLSSSVHPAHRYLPAGNITSPLISSYLVQTANSLEVPFSAYISGQILKLKPVF